MSASEFHYAWEWRLAATPDALWPYVADTNRFNRDAGVPPVEETAGERQGTRRLKLRKFGVLVEWDEEPFEWVKPRVFAVMRRYHSGPVNHMRVTVELIPEGDSATLVRYTVDATARNPLGKVAIPLQIGLLSARRFESVFRRYADEARRAKSGRFVPDTKYRIDLLPKPVRLTAGGEERLAQIRAELSIHFDTAIVDRLFEVIRRGDDFTVARIRPYVLAESWGVQRRAAVDLCLYATRAGLLDLQWDVLCPSCRGAKQTNNSLRGIAQPVHCDACNIDFNANFEQSVELTFRPNPAVRLVEVFPFCIGGPQITPHIAVQQQVPAGASRAVDGQLEPGRYRVRAAGHAGAQLFRVDQQGSEQIELVCDSAGWPNAEPLVRSDARLQLRNATEREALIIIERVAWSDQALTAAEVIALQEFRDLFAAEALRPGEAINVGSMAILFTDLRDSTRMYRLIGDAPAFGRVMDHFEILRQAMHEEEGALVKTIGDAVMAVFRRPAGAIRTVLRARELLATLPDGVRPPNLKAGIHFGPCIAVTLNDRLDYFGSTVNIAARLGGLSAGGEIIISDAVANDPEVRSLLNEPRVKPEPFEANVKGYDETLRLVRICSQEG
jgi:adenylate cyclase